MRKTDKTVYLHFSDQYCRYKKKGGEKNHRNRMSGIGRDIKRSSSSIALLEQEHLDQVTQECIQECFECLQRRRPHNLSGQPVPVSCYP